MMMTLSKESADQKSAVCLVIPRKGDGRPAPANRCHFDIPMSQLDIADYLGRPITSLSGHHLKSKGNIDFPSRSTAHICELKQKKYNLWREPQF